MERALSRLNAASLEKKRRKFADAQFNLHLQRQRTRLQRRCQACWAYLLVFSFLRVSSYQAWRRQVSFRWVSFRRLSFHLFSKTFFPSREELSFPFRGRRELQCLSDDRNRHGRRSMFFAQRHKH